MAISGEIVELSTVELHPNAHRLKEKAIAARQRMKRGLKDRIMDRFSLRRRVHGFPLYDWQRLCFVFKKLRPAKSCLEVGPGRGHLTRMIAQAQLFDSLTAIDIVPRPALPKAVDFQCMSVAAMDFPDQHFDTVICMEVLEHLDDESLKHALREIRRVCRGQLIVSVPYNETLPLPKYHKQQFTEDRVTSLFPTAQCSLLLKDPVTRVPWILIEEEHHH